jgi:hypothetical protein
VELKYNVQELKVDMRDVTGEALIRAMQPSTCRDFDIEPRMLHVSEFLGRPGQ